MRNKTDQQGRLWQRSKKLSTSKQKQNASANSNCNQNPYHFKSLPHTNQHKTNKILKLQSQALYAKQIFKPLGLKDRSLSLPTIPKNNKSSQTLNYTNNYSLFKPQHQYQNEKTLYLDRFKINSSSTRIPEDFQQIKNELNTIIRNSPEHEFHRGRAQSQSLKAELFAQRMKMFFCKRETYVETGPVIQRRVEKRSSDLSSISKDKSRKNFRKQQTKQQKSSISKSTINRQKPLNNFDNKSIKSKNIKPKIKIKLESHSSNKKILLETIVNTIPSQANNIKQLLSTANVQSQSHEDYKINFQPLKNDKQAKKAQILAQKFREVIGQLQRYFRSIVTEQRYKKKRSELMPEYQFIIKHIVRMYSDNTLNSLRGIFEKPEKYLIYIGPSLYEVISSENTNQNKTQFLVYFRNIGTQRTFYVLVDLCDNLKYIQYKVKCSENSNKTKAGISHLYSGNYQILTIKENAIAQNFMFHPLIENPPEHPNSPCFKINPLPSLNLHRNKKSLIQAATLSYYHYFMKFDQNFKCAPTKESLQYIQKQIDEIVQRVIKERQKENADKQDVAQFRWQKIKIVHEESIEMLKRFCYNYGINQNQIAYKIYKKIQQAKPFTVPLIQKEISPIIDAHSLLSIFSTKYNDKKSMISKENSLALQKEINKTILLPECNIKFHDYFRSQRFSKQCIPSENQSRSMFRSLTRKILSNTTINYQKQSNTKINNPSQQSRKKRRTTIKKKVHEIQRRRSRKISMDRFDKKKQAVSITNIISSSRRSHQESDQSEEQHSVDERKSIIYNNTRRKSFFSRKTFEMLSSKSSHQNGRNPIKYSYKTENIALNFPEINNNLPLFLLKFNHQYLLFRIGVINKKTKTITANMKYAVLESISSRNREVMIVPAFNNSHLSNSHIYELYKDEIKDEPKQYKIIIEKILNFLSTNYSLVYNHKILHTDSMPISQQAITSSKVSFFTEEPFTIKRGVKKMLNILNLEGIVKAYIRESSGDRKSKEQFEKLKLRNLLQKNLKGSMLGHRKINPKQSVECPQIAPNLQQKYKPMPPEYFKIEISIFPAIDFVIFILQKINPKSLQPIKYIAVAALSDFYDTVFGSFRGLINREQHQSQRIHQTANQSKNSLSISKNRRDHLALKKTMKIQSLNYLQRKNTNTQQVRTSQKFSIDLSAQGLKCFNYKKLGLIGEVKKKIFSLIKIWADQQCHTRKQYNFELSPNRISKMQKIQLKMIPILSLSQTIQNNHITNSTFVQKILWSISSQNRHKQNEHIIKMKLFNKESPSLSKQMHYHVRNKSFLLHVASKQKQNELSYYKFVYFNRSLKKQYMNLKAIIKIKFMCEKGDNSLELENNMMVFTVRENSEREIQPEQSSFIMKYASNWQLQETFVNKILQREYQKGHKERSIHFLKKIRRRFENTLKQDLKKY